VADIELPPALSRLHDLAYNFWWSWTVEARELFSTIDVAAWARYHNPVQLLLNVDRAQWERLLDSEIFLDRYSRLIERFDRYLAKPHGAVLPSGKPLGPVAYFSMEYALDRSLAIYSGGLGVLSGDHLKSASDLGVPCVGIGLVYRWGYFQQTVDADGLQQHSYPDLDLARLPLRPVADRSGGALLVKVPFSDREVFARVWLAEVGRVPLLLLDTDVHENHPGDRAITSLLYVRGREMRLAQELVLGVGGVLALAALGIVPDVWHLNEGHSAFLLLERLAGERQPRLDQALAAVRRNVLFTTHTPVPAGHERYDRPLADAYIAPWAERLGCSREALLDLGSADHGEPEQAFNMTALALRGCARVNAVSRLNAEVSNRMWAHLLPSTAAGEIEAITNGVHLPTWLGVEMRDLYSRYLRADWPWEQVPLDTWKQLGTMDLGELWHAHQAQKARLARFTRVQLRRLFARHGRSPSELKAVDDLFDTEVLTIGFARRFATYKRADLIFHDLHRLRGIVANHERPVQILFSGKAHPADRPGQELIAHIFQLSQEEPLRGRVFFLENYDLRIARMLVQGVDLWLNTPRRPLEASGTSGQKAGVNGVLNLSVLDGWWPEGFDGENGWAIGEGDAELDQWEQDQADAISLYRQLEEEIIPLFYQRDEDRLPSAWLAKMRHAIATLAPRFSSSRMVRDYLERAYIPLAEKKDVEVVVEGGA